jgi:hypothetical protein
MRLIKQCEILNVLKLKRMAERKKRLPSRTRPSDEVEVVTGSRYLSEPLIVLNAMHDLVENQ